METAANQLRTPDLPVEGPTYEDGNIPTQQTPAPQPAPAPQEQDEDGGEPAEPKQWKDEKRLEIFARAREKRQAETTPYSGDPNDPNVLYGSTTDQDDMGELEKEALRRRQQHQQEQLQTLTGQQPQPQQSQQGKPLNGLDPQFLAQRVPIIVDGQEREVSTEELIRNYQIDQAAQRRLEQAKALLQQTQEFQRYQQPQPGQPDAEYNEPSEQDDSTRDYDGYQQDAAPTRRKNANVKELVEKIQLGTPDEAAEALEEFVSSAVNRPPAVDETTRVLTALEDINAKQAVLSFAEKNPQIATNPIVQQAATRQIHQEMAADLMRAGYTKDQLLQLAPTEKHLTQLHKQARINGVRGIRQVSELVDAGYQGAMQSLREIVGFTAPARGAAPNQAPGMSQQRMQRKESLQPQPAARRLSPSMPAQTQAKTQDQSRAAAVARMRQARGQPV
jgi:hypothetical protein